MLRNDEDKSSYPSDQEKETPCENISLCKRPALSIIEKFTTCYSLAEMFSTTSITSPFVSSDCLCLRGITWTHLHASSWICVKQFAVRTSTSPMFPQSAAQVSNV